ncbi:fibronectin type III domain-containing protein [Tenacibaculum sp. M341]|uniref:fibronectin type III domain-containing protein n=1 Tax=Tenacibaculum sp. M341 TaxID=2530339 RepID=UPI00104BAC30|nr:hypothetical protein [Tenacibaculum sp. M341]TCI84696.1 hypothetical protein EYW44_20240 [Tenacibaculum sp. M341]
MKIFNSHIKYTGILFILFCIVKAEAQVQQAEVKIASRVQKDRVLLRWGATTASAWKATNSSGFILEKYVLSRNGKRLADLEKVWQKKLKAAPLEDWQEIVENNDNAAVIAQALFGEGFFVSGGNDTQLADIYNLANETEQRFSFSLLAAESNFEAAQKAGWGYVDKEVQKNETYVYRILANISAEKNNIKGNSVIAAIQKYEPLPSPIDFRGIFGDKSVTLTWEYQLLKSIYTSYHIERSEDGINFKSLSKEPLVNLNDKPNAPAKRMFFIDTLAQNDKTYYYRLQGISSFGEKSTYSKTIFGKGRPVLPYTPRITDTRLTEKADEAIVFWDFPKKGEALLQKFQIVNATKDDGTYVVVADNIAPSQRSMRLSNLHASNYIKIVAVGKDPKQEKRSFSSLIQLADNTPPEAPTGLTGKIDTLGIVKINWNPNIEKDLLGYRVFRGFTKEEEPSQVTISPISQNEFIDTVEVKNLNSKVFYQIVAVDKRHNHSDKSEVLVLEKPDLIPPISPVFTDYKAQKGKITLAWVRSPEKEITHILSRKNITQNTAWENILITQDTIQHFTDTKLMNNNVYRYKIKAVDKANLSSEPSSPLTIKALSFEVDTSIKGFNYLVDRQAHQITLFWRADEGKVAEYTIYKQLKGKPLSTWKVLPGKIKQIIDTEVSPNQTYIYHIRASLKDASYTKVKKVAVNY